jgi:hypothetical protein
MEEPHVLGVSTSPITPEGPPQTGVQDLKARKAQRASLLSAAITQRPVAVQNVLRADADDGGDDEAMSALIADSDEQEQIEDEKHNVG